MNDTSINNLDGLLNDQRLARLFSDKCSCVLQLWILQIKTDKVKETLSRILYGRLIPYCFENNRWSGKDDDDFDIISGKRKAQVFELNLYIKSELCKDLLKGLASGRSLSDISKALGLEFDKKLEKRFGESALTRILDYRPIAYLLNRYLSDGTSLTSPHGEGPAYSASIIQTEKNKLFFVDPELHPELCKKIIQKMQGLTGIFFGRGDLGRLGDIELLVFPTLDDHEGSLLEVLSPQYKVIVKFDPKQLESLHYFQFSLRIIYGSETIYGAIKKADRNAEGKIECVFELSRQIFDKRSRVELEAFGFESDEYVKGLLCYRWTRAFLNNPNLRLTIRRITPPPSFPWLEKKLINEDCKSEKRKEDVLTKRDVILESNVSSKDLCSQERDKLERLFSPIYASESQGWFFKTGGKNAIAYLEWFKGLLEEEKHKGQDVVIFDPYFGKDAFTLLGFFSEKGVSYTIYLDQVKSDLKKLKECYKYLSSLHNKNIRLKIINVKKLHDRYIFFRQPKGQGLTSGFHLSNSLNGATVKSPLLVTPIPKHLLVNLQQYIESLQKSEDVFFDSEKALILLKALRQKVSKSEFTPLLKEEGVGKVFALLLNRPSLENLSGESLQTELINIGVLDRTLCLPEKADFHSLFMRYTDQDNESLLKEWEITSKVLADIPLCNLLNKIPDDEKFFGFLKGVLEKSFSKSFNDEYFFDFLESVHKKLFSKSCGQEEWEHILDLSLKELLNNQIVDGEKGFYFLASCLEKLFSPRFEQEWEHFLGLSLKELLYSFPRIRDLEDLSKRKELTWSQFYAIKFLCQGAPSELLGLAEDCINRWRDCQRNKKQGNNTKYFSLLSQIFSEFNIFISSSRIGGEQRASLLNSQDDFLRWLGIADLKGREATESDMTESEQLLQAVNHYSDDDKRVVLGWLAKHAKTPCLASQFLNALYQTLSEKLPEKISEQDLNSLLKALHQTAPQSSQKKGGSETGEVLWWGNSIDPWIFDVVLRPLLEANRISYDYVFSIYWETFRAMLERLLRKLDNCGSDSLAGFRREYEGHFIQTIGVLYARSAESRRKAARKGLEEILKKLQRFIQRPLAKTSNWFGWDRALRLAMWSLALIQWSQYSIQAASIKSDLEELSKEAHKLATTGRSMCEWRRDHAELIEFMYEAGG